MASRANASDMHTASNGTMRDKAPLCHILTPVGMLVYGFPDAEIETALSEFVAAKDAPVAIILDSGSTDSGPSKLALVPLLISSSSGDGSDEHVDVLIDIIREICADDENLSWKLKVLSIHSGISKKLVSSRLEAGQVCGCGPAVPKLEQAAIEQTPRIVAQMGPEPSLQAMVANPDFSVVIGGRAYDPAPYVAYCAFHAQKQALTDLATLELGAFTHMGKILEGGGLCVVPKSRGAIATIYKDASFEIRPTDPSAKCTPLSVAAHTLYEKTRPDILTGPRRGSSFKHVEDQGIPYTVKLEGARVAGFRSLFMGSFRDPIPIPQIHTFLDGIKSQISDTTSIVGHWDLIWHVHGDEKRVFVVGEVLAATQADATNLASSARVGCIHAPYPGQKATSGNFGYGVGGKMEVEVGECADFPVDHLMELGKGEVGLSPKGLFRLKVQEVEEGGKQDAMAATGHGEVKASASIATEKERPITAKPPPPQQKPEQPSILLDLASVLRSKNAGPYEITLDVIFDSKATYEVVKSANILSAKIIAELYGLKEDGIIWSGFFDPALASKATIPRQRDGMASCSGGFGEDDVQGSQMYLPLAALRLPEGLVRELDG